MANRVFDFNDSIKEQEAEIEEKEKDLPFPLLYEVDTKITRENPMLTLGKGTSNLIRGVFDPYLFHGIFRLEKKPEIPGNKMEYEELKILSLDSRFQDFISHLGKNKVRLELEVIEVENQLCVVGLHEIAFGDSGEKTARDAFFQYTIDRILETKPKTKEEREEAEKKKDEIQVESLAQIKDFLSLAGHSLPEDLYRWALRNLEIVKSKDINPEERKHAQRALSMMLSIRWKDSFFRSIDPVEAKRILDEELFGMESLKQRIIETIIQINRTHRLPAYGILIVGPAGTGKSQIAYAIARILNLPWFSFDMSSINDAEQLTGTPRIYSNARPGSIMQAYSQAKMSNMVMIINELDKANKGKGAGDPSDVLLTLLDNLGFVDNYIECRIPTTGIYPIATANDKTRISDPLITRFTVIEIPDYTPEEKKRIFLDYSLPKVLKRLGMRPEECVVTEAAAMEVVKTYRATSGVRDLEQAAERLAAHALYLIEMYHVKDVLFDEDRVHKLLVKDKQGNEA